MSQNQYFRAGAGAVIYNETGEIALFSRSDKPHIWQLPQGGMDAGEAIEQTLWRELHEETALRQDDITTVTKYPTWLQYEYPPELRPTLKDTNCLGQIHMWYFLKLKPDIRIDLTKAADQEFNAVEWRTFAYLLSLPVTLKHPVYTTLAKYFTTHIQ